MSDERERLFFALIPDSATFIEGGIDPESWVAGHGNYELMIAYSTIFWPQFVEFEGYILREDFSLDALAGFEAAPGPRRATEATMNHIHIGDLHSPACATADQERYLGRILREIYEVKLRHDFPDRNFVVYFNDDEDPALDPDYQVTFWQEDPAPVSGPA